MSNLSEKKCVPCRGTTPILPHDVVTKHLKELFGWFPISDFCAIQRIVFFDNFKEALVFVIKVGALAEQENHHPDIHLTEYRRVNLFLTTHAVEGLTENDFIMAAKINEIYDSRK